MSFIGNQENRLKVVEDDKSHVTFLTERNKDLVTVSNSG
jgi:hypothetical protein